MSARLALACLALAACADRRPNLVLVTIDTLRADHTSLHGYERETTPFLDGLGSRGTVFERCWAPSSWTLPSMNMLFTGETRIENSGAIRPDQASLTEILAGAGYRTAAVVANPLLDAEGGFDRGFESYDLHPAPPGGGRVNSWPAREVTGRAIAALERLGGEPFFLFVHYFDPHDPYEPRGGRMFAPFDDAERRAAFRRALPPEERELLTDAVYDGIEARIALYDSEVREADRGVERLFGHLERAGLAERTLFVVTSDHGEGLWQRAATEGEEEKDHAYFPALYFDHGVQLYGEQVHVPLVLAGPGVPAGRRDDRPVSLLDLAPTLLAALGIEPPDGLDGRDLLDVGALEGREAIYSICSRGTTVTREGRWRLHEPRDYRVERFGARPELYDLESDPRELSPLDDAERTAALQALVRTWRHAYAEEWDEPPIDAAERELLERLGYTAGEAER